MDYWFDEHDRIAAVDDAWMKFAVANDAPELTAQAVVGLHLNDFVSDEATRELWTRLLARARRGKSSLVSIRCDAPRRRRTIRLRLLRDGERVLLRSIVVSEEPRKAVELLDRRRERGGPPLVACSWCWKFQHGGSWIEVEELIVAERLFDRSVLPAVSHGICPVCLSVYGAR